MMCCTFIEATGGTTATGGDYKIHTFNSSGNFVVSSTSNTSDNNNVSYLVVAVVVAAEKIEQVAVVLEVIEKVKRR